MLDVVPLEDSVALVSDATPISSLKVLVNGLEGGVNSGAHVASVIESILDDVVDAGASGLGVDRPEEGELTDALRLRVSSLEEHNVGGATVLDGNEVGLLDVISSELDSLDGNDGARKGSEFHFNFYQLIV